MKKNELKKTILIILDGWGINDEKLGNAIRAAETPVFDSLWESNPHTLLDASGLAVGLPEGQMGNSEVGHMNIGAGRIVPQELVRINKAVEDGSLRKNKVLAKLKNSLEENNGALHIMGLVSPGGVHSSMDHLYELLYFAKDAGISKVFLHAFLDGRDTPPKSALSYIKKLEKLMNEKNLGRIATVSGRFYAMDRDKRWKRIEKAYHALLLGEGFRAESGFDAVKQAYEREETDEFVKPTIIESEGIMKDGDAAIFFNFRADRAREMSIALNFDDFDGFERKKRVALSIYATMTNYREDFPFPVLFESLELTGIYGEKLSETGLSQLRIAETEKYAHVTFFFNGGREKVFEKEERVLVPSPKVETYDLKPEMSAPEVTEKLINIMHKYDSIVLNFANPDMVGHTGVFDATRVAVETVDKCLGKICKKAQEEDRVIFITADHGNAEKMLDNRKENPHTAHTNSKVPFIIVNGPRVELKKGKLGDIAPTILKISGVNIPKEMTGKTLF